MDCADIFAALEARRICERSSYGTKIPTHCLYPSADQVFVHIGMWGDKIRVSDGGDAARCAMSHGRDAWATEAGLKAASARYSLELEREELVAFAPSRAWLPNVVHAVANGAAHAANEAIAHANKKREKSLLVRIEEQLQALIPPKRLAKNYEQRGRSGKLWTVDFAITGDYPTLIKAVSPHHNSIAASYTAFSDLMDDHGRRLSVFERRPHEDDATLLRQVAELVPVRALEAGVQSSLRH